MTETIVDDVWFGKIGIVVIEDDLTKERKAYIGVGGGDCKEGDMEKIKSWGMPVPLSILKELCRVLEQAGREMRKGEEHGLYRKAREGS